MMYIECSCAGCLLPVEHSLKVASVLPGPVGAESC
jgi:hypothetical protein